jgi:endoglucanase
MKTNRHIALILSLLFLIGSSAFAQSAPPAKSIVELHGALSVKGNRVVDKDGNPVILRGMSLFWSQWMAQYYNADCIKWLRDDWHVTIIRLPMAVGSGGYLTNAEVERKKIYTVIQAAIDLGIYVIVDWHDDPANTHLAQSQAFFEQLAKDFGKVPNVMFEPWNEPLKTADWNTIIKPYHEAVISKIRQYSTNLVICGTQSWSQDVDKASKNPLDQSKYGPLAYTLHFYAGTHHQSLRDKATTAMKNGIPLFVTEWGTAEASGSGHLDSPEVQTWLKFLETNGISSCNWSVADKAETTAALMPGAAGIGSWTPEMLSPSGKLVRAELINRNAGMGAPYSGSTTKPTMPPQ